MRKTPWPGRGVFVCAVAALWGLTAVAAAAPCSRDLYLEGRPASVVRVARVVDGDTVRLRDGRAVRLIGINAPEMGYGTRPQRYGSRARSELARLLDNATVTLVEGREASDKHGRTLAHLFDAGGASVEEAMLAAGMAWHVTIPPNLDMADCLAAIEKRAKESRRGVWSLPPTPARNLGGGGFHRIDGRVTQVNFGKTWWISLDNQLAVRIAAQDQHRFRRGAIAGLKGRQVEVRGWVYPSHSEKYEPWRVNLHTPHSLLVR